MFAADHRFLLRMTQTPIDTTLDSKDSINAPEKKLNTRFGETYLLTKMLEEERSKSERISAELDKTKNKLNSVEKSIEELVHSRSWRMTEPVRALLDTIRRH